MEAEAIFEVMGATAHVIVVDDGPVRACELLERGSDRLRRLEATWSRFEPTSDVSRLNALANLPLVVAPETFALVELAVEGWRLTGGRFDPTVLPALVAAGYDRSFALVPAGGVPPSPPAGRLDGTPPAGAAWRSSAAGIATDPLVGSVCLGPGTAFDPGGIGKGLAADLVTRELLDAGARGACVNVGGDARVDGDAPGGEGWVVEAEHPLPGHAPLARLRLGSGAVASTWRTKRAWTGADGIARHHVIDPATGEPAARGLAGVCAITGPAWLAEVLAKGAFLAGLDDGRALLADHGAAGYLVTDAGEVHTAGDVGRFAA